LYRSRIGVTNHGADSSDSSRRIADSTTVVSTPSKKGQSRNDRSQTTIQGYPSGEGVAESIWPPRAFTGWVTLSSRLIDDPVLEIDGAKMNHTTTGGR